MLFLKEILYHLGSTRPSMQVTANTRHQLGSTVRTACSKAVGLHVLVEQFIRILLRAVSRQKDQAQSRLVAIILRRLKTLSLSWEIKNLAKKLTDVIYCNGFGDLESYCAHHRTYTSPRSLRVPAAGRPDTQGDAFLDVLSSLCRVSSRIQN
jgi:hypothetical protein